MISLFLYKGYGYLIKVNEKNSGVPMLMRKQPLIFLSNLGLKGNLYVLNVRALMHLLMMHEITCNR